LVNTGPENFENTPSEEAAAGGQNLSGEVAAGPKKRARYLHPIASYETIYGTKARAMKRWIAIGRDATPPELPPLDDPPRMKMWWVRCMTQRVPDKIVALAKVPPADPALPTDASPGPLFAQAAATTPTSPSSATGMIPTVGFAGALQRCRAAEAAAGELYTNLLRQAAADKDVDRRARLGAEAEHARRSWDELVDRLRTMERDAEKILSAGGRMWSADEVLASQELIHLALREGLYSLIRRVRPKLAGLQPGEQEETWLIEVELLFAGLRANKFTAPPGVVVAA
jgi:hypothetical protein